MSEYAHLLVPCTYYVKLWPVSKIFLSVCTLSQLPSPTKALFIIYFARACSRGARAPKNKWSIIVWKKVIKEFWSFSQVLGSFFRVFGSLLVSILLFHLVLLGLRSLLLIFRITKNLGHKNLGSKRIRF